MSHLNTIVKVRANNKPEAIKRVNSLLTADYEFNFPSPFDSVDEEATKISEECKSEADFKALRKEELKMRDYFLKKWADPKQTQDMRDYYLMLAGECAYASRFWSTERLAYDMYWEDGKKVYYVETDRHI